jgi:hypothetical protein
MVKPVASIGRFLPPSILWLVLLAAACKPSAVQTKSSGADSTVAVLMHASIPLVTGNMRYGELVADSLVVLDDATRFTALGVHLSWSVGRDTVRMRAAEGHIRADSGAVELVDLQLRTRAGREISASRGKFDGRNALHFMEGLRVDGRTIAPPLDGVYLRLDTGELMGCGRRCQ